MKKDRITNFLSEQKEKVTIDIIYNKNKHKGVTKAFVFYLVRLKLNHIITLLNTAKDRKEFTKLLRSNIQNDKSKNISLSLLTGEAYGLYDYTKISYINRNIADRYISHKITQNDSHTLIKLYKSQLINYINNHNKIKNRVRELYQTSKGTIEDFTTTFEEARFDKLCKYLFVEQPLEHQDREAIEYISLILFQLESLYDKDILLNHSDFVTFEIEYGYFDLYYNNLVYQDDIPSLEERFNTYNREKNITSEQLYRLRKVELLEERIASLTSPSKDLVLKKIELLKREKNIKKQAILIDECYEYYETKYREEIVSSLYSPIESHEVSDYAELQNILLHLFIRNPEMRIPSLEIEYKKEIIAKRGIKVTGEEELTEEEKKEFQNKIDYARDVLLNPVVTSESLNETSNYSDSSGLRWYRSNTSNQISASLFSKRNLLQLGNCVGVGFDNTSISPKNIICSSPVYQTTNMGIDNIEINPEYRFDELSAPLSELESKPQTEIVMFRKNKEIKTNPAYVFAIINGFDARRDEQTIEKARQYAEKNHIKLIIFNNKKLRLSYEEQNKAQDDTKNKMK